MNTSSNCIFHFFKGKDTLLEILQNQLLFGSYCKEILNYQEEEVPLYVPMISFCDIPLKTYSNSGAIYGKYGIGMSKEFALQNKLTPVLYIDKNSSLLDNLIKSLKSAEKTIDLATKLSSTNEAGAALAKDLSNSVEYIIYSLYHTKHYEDKLVRKDITIDSYKFYDEREWRFIPDFNCAICELKIAAETYEKWRGDGEKPLLKDKVRLTIPFNKIEYIIVESQSDVEQVIDFIMHLPDNLFSTCKKEYLITKIVCFQKIERDF